MWARGDVDEVHLVAFDHQLDTEDAGRQFIDQDLELLSSIGVLAAHLIEHARLIEKSRAEEMLVREHAAAERERRWLREVLELLPVGVFLSDARGKLLEANPEAQAIWGGDVKLPQRPEEREAQADWYPSSGSCSQWAAALDGLSQSRAVRLIASTKIIKISAAAQACRCQSSYGEIA